MSLIAWRFTFHGVGFAVMLRWDFDFTTTVEVRVDFDYVREESPARSDNPFISDDIKGFTLGFL